MCGIVGILDPVTGARPARMDLQRMNDALVHRGPDGEGLFLDSGIGLGHRRLAIIDVDRGHQPLFNEDGSVVVVFNGEIYNYRELTRELTARGHVFATDSDTEVLVHGWEEWGPACVQRLQGMFAFALWDRRQQVLFLARDRVGIKPLHYARLPSGRMVFGSELKALLAHPEMTRDLDPRAFEDYLAFGFIPDPRTLLRDARKLPPGHTLLLGPDGRGEPRRYWDLHFSDNGPSAETTAVNMLQERLDASVGAHMIADVPLGAFLSGGVDSSSVVAAMARHSEQPVHTCSIRFGDPAFDESAHAQQVADLIGAEHRVESVDIDDLDRIDRLPSLYDEPFADSSALPTTRLCEIARRSVTVALSGDGGDEAFAGYGWYAGHAARERVRRWLPAPLRGPVFGAIANAIGDADGSGRRASWARGWQRIADGGHAGYAASTMITTARQRDTLFSPALKRELAGYRADTVVADHARRADTDDPLALAQFIDFQLYLPGDILTKVDRASMANSLEVRVPLLDHKLLEWAATLPASLKLHRGEGKYVLKKAAERRLPKEILYRRKMGLSIPLADWFRGALRTRAEALAESEVLLGSGLIQAEGVAELVRAHMAREADHSTLLWALLMLDGSLRGLEAMPMATDTTAIPLASAT
ncbi:XrtA/PEP-CTERM system amidotransferase [Halofilum ochraceum]|uniref:XrtA/PEP-CTERM system amidotransferase n=1 Tax=Halofilum ochraceum TaxID=1611323 RepID=UPI0008301CEF|nr:XrtA/PEP-CTERM system amidotransferase [Halofilum ochraceum]